VVLVATCCAAPDPVRQHIGHGWHLFAWIILVETIVQWPGIGLYAYQSFQSLDYNPIMGITLVVSVIFVVLNFLIDLLYPLLDPRVRTA
jgi:peptide/nickel transport system permease protein